MLKGTENQEEQTGSVVTRTFNKKSGGKDVSAFNEKRLGADKFYNQLVATLV